MVIEADMTVEEKIDRAIVEITTESPFFSYLVLNAQFEADPNLPALAGVGADGKGRYNPYEIEEEALSVEELKGLIVHETMHLALQHPWIDLPDHWDEETKNIAQELEINGTINLETDYELPSSGYVPYEEDNFRIPTNEQGTENVEVENATDKDIFDLYSEIKEKMDENDEPPKHSSIGGQSGEGSTGQSTDGGSNSKEEQESQSENGGEADKKQDDKQNESASSEGNIGDYDIDKQTGFDVHGQGDENDAEDGAGVDKEDWDEALSKAIQHAVSAGNQPQGMEEKVEELMGHDFNWRDELDQFVKEQIPQGFTYERPSPTTRIINRQVAEPTYLPDTKYEESINIIVSIDASGSVSSTLLGKFKADMISIARSYDQVDMTVISHDTVVHDEWKMVNGQIEELENWQPVGRGGTDLIAPFEYVKEEIYERPDVMILFTDGQGQRPDSVEFPTLWVLAGSHVAPESVKTGRTIVAKEGGR